MGINRVEEHMLGQSVKDRLNGFDSSLLEKMSQADLSLKADKTTTDNLQNQVSSLASGAPKAVSLVSQMTDTTKNYAYTGAESGYTAGNWYYYNGSSWVSGGVYQGVSVVDGSITAPHLDSTLMSFLSISKLSPSFTTGSYVNSSGVIATSTGFEYSSPIAVKAGQTMMVRTKGYLTTVGIVSTCNSSGGSIQSVVPSIDSVSRMYQYTFTNDGYAIASGRDASGGGTDVYLADGLAKSSTVTADENNFSNYTSTIGNTVVSINMTKDQYVNSSGVKSSSTTFFYSSPIALNSGQLIKFYGSGYSTNVSLISTCDINGNNIVPVVTSTDSTKRVYTYTASSNGYVILSGHYTDNPYSVISTAPSISTDIPPYINMFHKIGVIGDSLSSGELAYTDGTGDHYVDRYESSWLSNIARSNVATKVHYSQGGMTAKAWMQDSGGFKTSLINESTACNAYFVALGTNDKNQSYPIGTTSDASGTDSFVGYMRQIIELIRSKNPNAVIFLVSLYNNDTNNTTYSNMVQSIAGLYNNTFYVDFINNTTIYTSTGGVYSNLNHFTTTGYVIVGKTIENLVNNVVANNMDYFKFFGLNN